MPRDPSPAAKWSQYLALRALVGLAYVLGVRVSLLIAATIGRLFFRIDRKHRRRSINHVRLAFPQWDDRRIENVARRSCQRFLQLAVEMIFMPRRIRKSNYERHLVRHDPISALDLFYAREPMVMAVGHFGNWEAAGYFFSLEGHAIAATARPLDVHPQRLSYINPCSARLDGQSHFIGLTRNGDLKLTRLRYDQALTYFEP